jgi:hypothetical protein
MLYERLVNLSHWILAALAEAADESFGRERTRPLPANGSHPATDGQLLLHHRVGCGRLPVELDFGGVMKEQRSWCLGSTFVLILLALILTARNNSNAVEAQNMSEFSPLSNSISFDVFGNGSDGDLIVESGDIVYTDEGRVGINGTIAAGENVIPVTNTIGFSSGDMVLIHQSRG